MINEAIASVDCLIKFQNAYDFIFFKQMWYVNLLIERSVAGVWAAI